MYQASYPKQAFQLCQLGATDVDIAKFFEVSLDTFYKWQFRHKDFAESIKVGKQLPNDRTVRSLYMKANGFWVDTEKLFVLKEETYGKDGKVVGTRQYVHHEPTREYYPPDTGAICFFLKNRVPEVWRDKHEVEGTIRNEHVFTFNIFERDLIQRPEPKLINGSGSNGTGG